jgi:hypothetical protein
MEYNIVTNLKLNQWIRGGSKFYTVQLGLATTKIDQAGDRQANKDDQFSFVYSQHYKSQIHTQGYIGNIRFYTDHQIREDVLIFYYEREEFVFEWDPIKIREKGVDAFLGGCIKKIETEYKERLEKAKEDAKRAEEEAKNGTTKPQGDPSKISGNPGAVSFEDIKAYLAKQNADRLKT